MGIKKLPKKYFSLEKQSGIKYNMFLPGNDRAIKMANDFGGKQI